MIDPATFRTVPPAPQPKPAILTLADVVGRTGMDEAEIEVARTLGFPKPCATREFEREGARWVKPLWNERDVAQWMERQGQVMRRG